MKKTDWNEGLNHLDEDLVEEFVLKGESIRKKKRKETLGLRFGAMAACFCLLIGTILGALLHRDPDPALILPQPRYSAEEIAKLLDLQINDGGAANAYLEIYAPSPEHLDLAPLPQAEALEIYEFNGTKVPLNKEDFSRWIKNLFPKITEALKSDSQETETDCIDREEEILEFPEDGILEFSQSVGQYRLWARQNGTQDILRIYNASEDGKISLDGKVIQMDRSLADEEIINGIQSVKDKLFELFDTSFSDIKIIRKYDAYSQWESQPIYIYFYDRHAHPLNSTQERPVSDYIVIEFHHSYPSEGDAVSDGMLSASALEYVKKRTLPSDAYSIVCRERRISLSQAEALLFKGYVFGGHSCSLCMENQEKVSFENYDFVDLEYLFGRNTKSPYQETTGIPFYAFYKQISTSQNGNTVYAKTYVPAIEVRDCEAYFQSQTKNHS